MKNTALLRIQRLAEADAVIAKFVATQTDRRQPVSLLLPAATVTRAELELPRMTGNKLRSAVAYALEDRFIGDADSQHIAIGTTRIAAAQRQKVSAAIIERSSLAKLLEQLAACGVATSAAHADADCITSRPGDVLLWLESDDAHWITPAGDRLTLPAAGLREALQWLALGEQSRVFGLKVYAAPDLLEQRRRDIEELRDEFSQLQLQPLTDPLAWLQSELTAAAPINLLQGDFAPQRDNQATLSRWRWPLRLAAAMIAIFLLSIGLDADRNNRNAARIEQRIYDSARDVLPASAAPRTAVGLLQRQAQALTVQNEPTDSVLALLQQAVNSTTMIGIDRLEFENGTLRLHRKAIDGAADDAIETLEFRR